MSYKKPDYDAAYTRRVELIGYFFYGAAVGGLVALIVWGVKKLIDL